MSDAMRDIDMTFKIAELVKKNHGSTYYVGGYVRDKVLHRENKDIDIEIHGIDTKTLKSILSSLGEVDEIGASFGVYNLHGYDIDISQPRKERSVGDGHKDFDVEVAPYIGTKEAARRRDFTMNALMADVLTGEILDFYGGLDDIKHKAIRHVDDSMFADDPLRVFRAAQFAARFGFTVDSGTETLMSNIDLKSLASERVWGEMEKAFLKSDNPSVFFDVLRRTNQLDYWFPEVKSLIDCPQPSVWHPEGDVYNHTMLVIDEASKVRNDSHNPVQFMTSALCHDFGKPKTLSYDDKGVPHSYNHGKAGVPIVETFLSRLNNDVSLGKYVKNMVLMHDEPYGLQRGNAKLKSTNKMFDKCIDADDLLLLIQSDSLGSLKEDRFETFNRLKSWYEERLSSYRDLLKTPEVMGRDLVSLGMKPGEEFGRILAESHTAYLSMVPKRDVLKGICSKYNIEVDDKTLDELAPKPVRKDRGKTVESDLGVEFEDGGSDSMHVSL